jgi:hypothetical protein
MQTDNSVAMLVVGSTNGAAIARDAVGRGTR